MAAHELSVEPRVSDIPRLNAWVATLCAAATIGDNATARLTLAIEEAVMNVIDHAFFDRPPPHIIKVALAFDASAIVAEIIDNGHPYDPTAAPEPDIALPLERRQPGGLGVHFMRNAVDRLSYRYRGGCNVLRLETARGDLP